MKLSIPILTTFIVLQFYFTNVFPHEFTLRAIPGHRTLGFLDGADEKFKREYMDILIDKKMMKKEILAKVEEFVKKLPEENQKKYREHRDFQEKRQRDLDYHFEGRLMKLSSEVQDMANKMLPVYRNMNLTLIEQCEKVAAINTLHGTAIKDKLQMPRDIACELHRFSFNY